MLDINEIQENDIFSETSFYKLKQKNQNNSVLFHFNSGKEVTLSNSYITEFLSTCDIYDKEIVCGKEDKFYTQKQIDDAKKKGEDTSNLKVGDLRLKGIKSLWEEITTSQVFTVCFKKKDTPLSNKKLQELKDAQIVKALEDLEKAQKQKKGVLDKAKEVLAYVQANPILPFEEGEDRILRGYKLQFKSEDGFYSVRDLDIDKNGERLVNINAIKFLVFDGTKFIVEK